MFQAALGEAAATGLKGPEVAAAQTVLLELAALHKLKVAAEAADPVRLRAAVAEAKALASSAALSAAPDPQETARRFAEVIAPALS